MRIFIDCTQTLQSDLNTGIQRVVRNVIRHCEAVGRELGVSCFPVVIYGRELRRVDPFVPELLGEGVDLGDIIAGFLKLVKGRFSKVWELMKRHLSPDLRFRIRRWLSMKKLAKFRPEIISPGKGDVLLLLDAAWEDSAWDTLKSLKKSEVLIGFNSYDIIPISHPQFCSAILIDRFRFWFSRIIRVADFATAISEDARANLEKFISQPGFRSTSFRLGGDLSAVGTNSSLDPELHRYFAESNGGVYLTVSTIEPRKNHAYLLDTFERLWEKGSEAKLCIVGKIGWECNALVRRIRGHSEWGRKLRMFNSVDDSALDYCYQNARALLFPSKVEGFGLPIVEALQRGLPVLASDIPVFREVGGEFVRYFSLDNPAELSEMIAEIEQSGKVDGVRSPSEFSWPDWRESTRELLEAVVQLTAENSRITDSDRREQGTVQSGL